MRARDTLLGLGLLALLAPMPARAQTMRRPTACSGCIANWYYFDRNGSGAGQEDWNCGASTYNNHHGSDFSLAGGNGAIDTGYDVVATADGTVASTLDGNYDHCNTCDATVDSRCGRGFGTGYGNYVVINHGSYRVVYAHMRQGSVRVSPGAVVRCGDVIGQIGSSGCSTGAHLHYETRPLGGAWAAAFDPFAGSCSSTSPSLWTSQGSYRGLPAATCDGSPPPPTCPSGTYPIWTCNTAGTNRRRCIDGVDETEPCPYGCRSMPVGTDDVCAPAPDADGDGARADVDCDDGNPSRYPGATEVCGDGVDQDCDGSDLTCPPVGTDAGTPPGDDAGVTPVGDAGTTPTDAGPDFDGGPDFDAGPSATPDAGDDTRSISGGCSCRTAPGGEAPLGLFTLLALGILVRSRAR